MIFSTFVCGNAPGPLRVKPIPISANIFYLEMQCYRSVKSLEDSMLICLARAARDKRLVARYSQTCRIGIPNSTAGKRILP